MRELNYYQILGLNEDVTTEEIKVSYRQLAKEFHPDLNAENKQLEEQMKQINIAYEILSDEQKREAYDQNLFFTQNLQEEEEEDLSKKDIPKQNDYTSLFILPFCAILLNLCNKFNENNIIKQSKPMYVEPYSPSEFERENKPSLINVKVADSFINTN